MTVALTESTRKHLAELESGPTHRFADGAHPQIPRVCCGVYTIWDGNTLVYVGHAGRAVHVATGNRRTGLADRLFHHSGGRRSGDQFCVYVADRLVLPKLTAENLADIAAGHLLLDDFVYVYVQDRLAYRVTITADVAVARAVENAARGGVLDAGKPVLNPYQHLSACPRQLVPRRFGSDDLRKRKAGEFQARAGRGNKASVRSRGIRAGIQLQPMPYPMNKGQEKNSLDNRQ